MGEELPAEPAEEDSRSREPVRSPVGTRDVLWPESARWESLVATFASHVRLAGYGLLLTPVIEDAGLFRRGVGETSEVVGKEMYEFADRGGRLLALRPEGTAPVVRAFVQHRPAVPWKVWYVTPAFRYERPQAGRYRQHHQLGVEVLGTDDPDLDVEVVALAALFYSALGLTQVDLALNSMGCAADRPAYAKALREYLHERRDLLCDEHRESFEANPLRVLDCKRPQCIAATEDAPKMIDYLDDSCADHFARVREGLESLGVPHRLEPRLVRGLDYYTRTTFEFTALALDTAQNAIGGGGRYDGLSEAIGGPATPGIGFGIGIERLLLACDAEGTLDAPAPEADVFVVDVSGGGAAREITAQLRDAGLVALRAYDGRSMGAQLKLADRSGARYAAIVGERELETGVVTLRNLRHGGDESTKQEVVPREALVGRLLELNGEPEPTPNGTSKPRPKPR